MRTPEEWRDLTYCCVVTKDGSTISVEAEHRQEIIAAINRCLSAKGDTMLTLALVRGEDIEILASQIGGVGLNTPEGREAQWACEEARDAHRKSLYPGTE